MEQLEMLQTYKIEGYTDDQVNFTIEELKKGTDDTTLQIFLFKKFGLFDSYANDLITKARKVSKIQPKNHLAESERIYANDLASERMNHSNQSNSISHESSDNSGSIILGVIILLIGLFVTFGSDGHVIAYGAILVGLGRIFSGLSSN